MVGLLGANAVGHGGRNITHVAGCADVHHCGGVIHNPGYLPVRRRRSRSLVSSFSESNGFVDATGKRAKRNGKIGRG
jgi:hypothetical protein